jgi:putative ubiquitin-RnfH superfamily antitoxin RatB of RatAB toxin-antitoxin module
VADRHSAADYSSAGVVLALTVATIVLQSGLNLIRAALLCAIVFGIYPRGAARLRRQIDDIQRPSTFLSLVADLPLTITADFTRPE